jgi:hypothetical protein
MLERLDRWVIEHLVRTLEPDAARLRQAGIRFAGELRAAGQATDKLPSADEFVIQQDAR